MLQVEQIGFSTASLAEYSLEGALRAGRELGFSSVEVLGFEGERHSIGRLGGFAFHERPRDEWGGLGRQLAGFSRISVHAPFIQVPLLSANAGVAREGFRQMQCAVEGIASAGGSVCTVHVNARPFLTIRDCWNQAVDVLGRLGDIGQKNGVVAAVETGYPSTVEDYCGLIEAANHPNVGACIDVGHIFRYYPNDLFGTEAGIEAHNSILEQIVRRLGAKVAILHLHDNRREDFRDHRAPGRGIIDFPRLMRALDDIDFQGPMVLELEEPDMLDALREGREFLGMIVRNIDS